MVKKTKRRKRYRGKKCQGRKKRKPTPRSRCVTQVLKKLHHNKANISSKAKGAVISYIHDYSNKNGVRPGQRVPTPKDLLNATSQSQSQSQSHSKKKGMKKEYGEQSRRGR